MYNSAYTPHYSSSYSSMRMRRSGSFRSGRHSRSAWDLGPPSSLYRERSRGLYNSTYRARFNDGYPKPSFDDMYFRYRKYAPDDNQALDDGKTLIKLDFCKDQNQKEHHTDKYGPNVPQMVVRRGQPFVLDVHLSGDTFQKGTDRIKLLFSAGNKAQESKGTLVNVNVCNDKKECAKNGDKWKAYIASASSNVVQVRVTASSDAIVSSYKVTVKVFLKDEEGGEQRFVTNVEDEMYLLFNPWSERDQTHMTNPEERNEYVLNDTGRVYVGSSSRIHGRPWVFGQFEKSCLEAAMFLLDKSYLNKRSHGNATQVSRALSAMANSCDYDNGVLTGNWSGNYNGGTSPSAWNGSVAILEEYMLTKRAVKYGQCWVFSGLLTTLCRTLGIPTRSVTNFESAHDTDCSMTIDDHYNTDLEPIDELNGDSVWNFHVWNEGWFKRPDLPAGYDGWQAFDATPQEESENMMRCGPAPLTAIKEGNVFYGFDAKFIFAEVNGDRVTWLVAPDGDMKPLKEFSDPGSVGKHISTKAVGSTDRHDVTNMYKHPEGSDAERDAVQRASQFSSRKSDLESLYEEGSKDVTFKCEGTCHKNGDIELKFGARNTSTTEDRTILVKIRSAAVYYTGVVGEQLTTKQEEISLTSEEGKEIGWRLPSASYLNMINEDAKLKVYVSAKVKETDQFFTKNEIYNIDKPDLDLALSKSSVKVGESVTVTIKFTNPVNVDLTQGVLRLEGPGIQRNLKIPIHRKVAAGGEMVENVPLTPQYAGKRELVVCFNSRQLTGITGVVQVDVKE